MLKGDERTILYFDAVLTARAGTIRGVPPLNARQLARHIEKLAKTTHFPVGYSSNTQTVYLSDFKYDGNNAQFLINCSDTSAVDPTFTNPRNAHRREIKKKRGEGVDFSAHAVWVLDDHPTTPDQYTFLLEQVPGLASPRVAGYITKLIKQCAQAQPRSFTIPHPDGTTDASGRTKRLRLNHSLALYGHISDEFKNDINNGKVHSIELMIPQGMTPWDSKGYTRQKSKSIFLTPAEDRVLPKNWALVSGAVSLGREDYETARIRFENADGKGRTIQLDTTTLGLANDHKYVKKHILSDFNITLKGSYEGIDSDIMDKMLELV